MGLGIDTVLLDVHNAATSAIGLTAATAATGDSLNVRSFDKPAYATLDAFIMQASGTRQARIISPRMHDNVTGLTFQTSEQPGLFLMPPEQGQALASVDALVVQMDAAASSDSVGALVNYYSDLTGIAADLRRWADIKPKIINLKTMEVDVTTSGTIGAWQDTVITTTENQLKADEKYAVLGFESNTALAVMGIKGPATGNLRVCAPGATQTLRLSDYFIEMERQHNRPYIPVFKANDRGNTYVSTAANTASVSAKVVAILAQLDE